MGAGFYTVFAVWLSVLVALIAAKRLFWPPVYALGIPVSRQQLPPIASLPPVGTLVRSVHGTAKVTEPGRVLFIGAKPIRSLVALTAAIEVRDGVTVVVARVPADAACGAALCVGLSLSFSIAIWSQSGDAVAAFLAALFGIGLVALWWTVYRTVFLGFRRADVAAFVEELDAGLSLKQA